MSIPIYYCAEKNKNKKQSVKRRYIKRDISERNTVNIGHMLSVIVSDVTIKTNKQKTYIIINCSELN